MKKLLIFVCAAVLLAGAALYAVADGSGAVKKPLKASEAKKAEARQLKAERPHGTRSNAMARLDREIKLPDAPAAFGSIVYDTATISAIPTDSGRTIGNQFNTALTVGGSALGPVQLNGTITKLTWAVWGNSTAGGTWGSFWITFYGPVNGTTAPILRSSLFSGLGGSIPQLVSYTFSTPIAYTGSSFLIGMLNSNNQTSPPWNGPCPVLDANTINGQGHHGMGISWWTSTGTGFAPITTLNAIMRPTGDVLTPVELMSFSVE